MAWAVLWRRCVLVSPIAGCVQSLRAPFSFSSSFCSSKGLAAVARLEGGGRGGAAGGGGGCNWRLEPCYPSRCPHQPISIQSAVQSRRSIRKTRPLTSILILYGWCGRGMVFHVALPAVQEHLIYLVLPLIRSQHQTHSGLAWVSANSLGLLARHGVNCCLCLWYANVSFFSSSLFWGVEVSEGCRQRRLLTLTVKWASLCKSIGCSAGQRFIYRDALTPDTDDANCKQNSYASMVWLRLPSSSPTSVFKRGNLWPQIPFFVPRNLIFPALNF